MNQAGQEGERSLSYGFNHKPLETGKCCAVPFQPVPTGQEYYRSEGISGGHLVQALQKQGQLQRYLPNVTVWNNLPLLISPKGVGDTFFLVTSNPDQSMNQ